MGYCVPTGNSDCRVCDRKDSLDGFDGSFSVLSAAGGLHDDLGDEYTASWLSEISYSRALAASERSLATFLSTYSRIMRGMHNGELCECSSCRSKKFVT